MALNVAVIASNAAAADSSAAALTLLAGESVQVYAVPRLTGSEQVTLTRDNGAAYQLALDRYASGVVLNHRCNTETVNGPGKFVFNKTATKVATAILIDNI